MKLFLLLVHPIQYAAIKAYENDHSDYIDKSKNILNAIGNYVYENLKIK